MVAERNERVEALVRDWILARADIDNDHLRHCDQIELGPYTLTDGTYGCDTGCDYLRWEGTVRCPHGSEEISGGEFGSLDLVIWDLEAIDKREVKDGRADLGRVAG